MSELVSYWLDLVRLDAEHATFERTLGGGAIPRLVLDVEEWVKLGRPSRLVIEPKPVEVKP